MKIALYIEEGLEQLVLTPQSDHETALLAKLSDKHRHLEIRHGSFYTCRGGWARAGSDDKSTMIVLRPMTPDAPDPCPHCSGRFSHDSSCPDFMK